MLFGENHTTAIQEGIQHCILNEWKRFERYIFASSKVKCECSKDCGHTYTFNQLRILTLHYDFQNILSSAKHHSILPRLEFTVAMK